MDMTDDRRAALEFAREAFHKANEAATSGANLALRMSLLINGGAAVALLAFIKDLSKEQQHAIADTLVWFGFGVTAAVLALALAYFTNYSLGQVEVSRLPTDQFPYLRDGPTTAQRRRRYWVFLWAAIIVGLTSIALFVIGLLLVRDALTKLA
jgi:hypothetical protein